MDIWAQEYITTLYPETIFCPIPHTEPQICLPGALCFLGQFVLFTLDKVSISLYYLKFSLSNKAEAEDFKSEDEDFKSGSQCVNLSKNVPLYVCPS